MKPVEAALTQLLHLIGQHRGGDDAAGFQILVIVAVTTPKDIKCEVSDTCQCDVSLCCRKMSFLVLYEILLCCIV